MFTVPSSQCQFRSRFLDQFLDVLAAGPDERADFFGVDLDRFNARRVFADSLRGAARVLAISARMCNRATRVFSIASAMMACGSPFASVELETGDAFSVPAILQSMSQ